MRVSGVQNGWFVVVPSVSDGIAQIPLAERERYTGTGSALYVSRMSEMIPIGRDK